MKNIKNCSKSGSVMLLSLLAAFAVTNIFPTRAPVQVESPRSQPQPLTAAEVLMGSTMLKSKQQNSLNSSLADMQKRDEQQKIVDKYLKLYLEDSFIVEKMEDHAKFLT